MANSRYDRLLVWLREHYITFVALGEQLGVSDVYARQLCKGQTIPVGHHEKMIALGLPADMLPEPFDRKRGRPWPKPNFPGLSSNIHADGQA